MIHGYLKIDAKKCLDLCELWVEKRTAYIEKLKNDVIEEHIGKRKFSLCGKKLTTPEDVLEWYENKEGSIFHSPFGIRFRTKYDVDELISICKAGGEVFVSQTLYSIINNDLEGIFK